MKMLPDTQDSPVIRTDFEDRETWEKICTLIQAPVRDGRDLFYAYVAFVEDSEFRDLSAEELLARVPSGYPHNFLLVIDKMAIQHPEFAVLAMDLKEERGRTFRAIPAQIQGIQNNLSISNMDFYEFADNADADGVFRGFPEL